MITIAKLHYIFSTLLTRNPFVVMVPKHFRKAHVYTLRKTWCSPFWCGAFLFVDRFIKKNFHLWMPRSLCSSCTTKAPHGGGGYSPIWPMRRCATEQGMVLESKMVCICPKQGPGCSPIPKYWSSNLPRTKVSGEPLTLPVSQSCSTFQQTFLIKKSIALPFPR